MGDETILNAMYPTMSAPKPPSSPPGTPPVTPVPASGDPQSPASDQAARAASLRELYPSLEKPPDAWVRVDPETPAADALFGNPGGDAPTSGGYEFAIAGLFDGFEKEARIEGDQERIELSWQSRHAFDEALTELEIGSGFAREIASLAGQYNETRRTGEEAVADQATTLADLQAEWGPKDFAANIDGARAVVAQVAKTTPGLVDFLAETGMGNDITLIRNLAIVARRRGLIK